MKNTKEGFIKTLIKESNIDDFEADTIVEDVDLDVVNYDNLYKVVFENDKYQICKPLEQAGMIPLADGTTWLGGYGDKHYDEVDFDSWSMKQWEDMYFILDKKNPKKKYMFRRGDGQLYSPSYAYYPCATWVAKNGDVAMWKWFMDQKFPYITTNLDKKVGSKLISTQTVYHYPEDSTLSKSAKEGSSITEVVIAPGTTKITSKAFAGLNKVKSINIPDTVTSIGSYCFQGCKSLESIKIPARVKTLSSGLFGGCESLKSVEFSPDVKAINNYCFSGCKSLKNITLPKAITVIPQNCFSDCESLKTIELHEGIVEIAYGAFAGSGLTSIKFPSTLTTIRCWAFSETNLKNVFIPSSVTTISDNAFEYTDIHFYCESPVKPRGWGDNWNVKREDWIYGDNRNLGHWRRESLPVEWGATEEMHEDLDIESDVNLPQELSPAQCDKLLELLSDLPDLAENNQPEFLSICRNWLMNIWFEGNRVNTYLLDSYINSLTTPGVHHIPVYWAKTDRNGGANYILARFDDEGLDAIVQDPFSWEYKHGNIDNYNTICVSTDFLQEYLGVDTDTIKDIYLGEDIDIEPIDMPDTTIYEDEHWRVDKPNNQTDFERLAAGTRWVNSERDDWRFSYYNNPPLFIFENKSTGERFLYNTRETYFSVRTEDGDKYDNKNNYEWHHKSAGNNLARFLQEQPNTEKLIRWCVKKWPQGMDVLKAQLAADDELAKTNGAIVYNSELYKAIKEVFWYGADAKSKKLLAIKDRAKTIIFPRNTRTIEPNAFREWKGLTEVVIPNSVKVIGDGAFEDCKNLEHIVLPNKLESIGDCAFMRTALTGEVTIPETCSKVGAQVFAYTQSNLVVKCDFTQKPDGWDYRWDVARRNSARPQEDDSRVNTKWLDTYKEKD